MPEILDIATEKMNKTISVMKQEYNSLRAGRANPAVLDKLTVDYYGTPTPINQVAAVAVAEARVLTITPWDASLVRAIEKAILSSDIGNNPTNDGRMLRLVFHATNEERSKQLKKDVMKMWLILSLIISKTLWVVILPRRNKKNE